MTTIRTPLVSFAGGEIAPELYGRMDLDKRQTGLALARNFLLLPHGPAQNRAGLEHIIKVKDSTKATRVLRFAWSVDQTMFLEFGDQYVRFHSNGETLLETAKNITAVTQANPGVVTSAAHGYSNGQWVFIKNVGGMTSLNNRWWEVRNVAANTFTLRDIYTGVDLNTSALPAYTAGGTAERVYEIASPFLEAELFDLHYVQDADTLTITHPAHPVMELRRVSATDWTLTEAVFAPTLSPPSEGVGVAAPIAHSYRVTSRPVRGVLTVGSAPSATATCNNDLTIPGCRNTITWTATGFSVRWDVYKLVGGTYYYIGACSGQSFTDDGDIAPDLSKPQPAGVIPTTVTAITATASAVAAPGVAVTASGAGAVSYTYCVTSVSDNGLDESIASATVTCTNDLTVAGQYNVVSWSRVPGVNIYKVFKETNGRFGYIGTSGGYSFKDDNILPDISQSPPVLTDPFARAGDYPGAVAFFEQRRVFAGTDNQAQTVFATRTGSSSNMTASLPLVASDAFSFTIAAREQNRIRHLVPLQDLLALTAGGEWRIFTDNGEPFAPATVTAKVQSYNGANNVQPVVTSRTVVYAQAQGGRIREVEYSWENRAYNADDITIMSPHLVDGYDIVDMAFSRGPVPVVWAVRNDGVLLANTYLPEQKVRAWSRHDTDGTFESVCCVPEGNEDILYAVVKREVGGVEHRFIERLHERRFTDVKDAFFVDAGLTYSGAATTVLTGLWHLEGLTVVVLGDACVIRKDPSGNDLVVSGGQITLPQAVEKAHVGLSYLSDLKTLPLAFESRVADWKGTQKNVSKVFLRVNESRGIYVGPDADRLRPHKGRTTEPYGTPPRLISGEIEVPIESAWSAGGEVFIRQADPLPLTICSLTLQVSVGG